MATQRPEHSSVCDSSTADPPIPAGPNPRSPHLTSGVKAEAARPGPGLVPGLPWTSRGIPRDHLVRWDHSGSIEGAGPRGVDLRSIPEGMHDLILLSLGNDGNSIVDNDTRIWELARHVCFWQSTLPGAFVNMYSNGESVSMFCGRKVVAAHGD